MVIWRNEYCGKMQKEREWSDGRSICAIRRPVTLDPAAHGAGHRVDE